MSAVIAIEAVNTKAFEKIKTNVYPLRDITITVLSSKTVQEMQRVEGKERLKTELRARYEGRLGPKVISEVYISDVTMQAN
jgi:flagellar basal body-associated protein FliL